jgi:hypothetical protein
MEWDRHTQSMSSQRRIEASRRNGALSRGPKTEAGKSRSSQNALQHGILAERVVLSNESKEAFEDALNEYIDKYQPRDGVEVAMVEQMATCFWRMQRAIAVEKGMLDRALENHPNGRQINRAADAWCEVADAGRLQTIHRYQVMLDRMEVRTQRKLLLARKLEPENPKLPKEPSSISGHSDFENDPPQPSTAPHPESAPQPSQNVQSASVSPVATPETPVPALHLAPSAEDAAQSRNPRSPGAAITVWAPHHAPGAVPDPRAVEHADTAGRSTVAL